MVLHTPWRDLPIYSYITGWQIWRNSRDPFIYAQRGYVKVSTHYSLSTCTIINPILLICTPLTGEAVLCIPNIRDIWIDVD